MSAARETAYAKINLALHVRERMPDGYHRIETLFAFCEDGDVLEVAPGVGRDFSIAGPFAHGLTAGPDNLVLAAARLLDAHAPQQRPFGGFSLHLQKRLPVAAGLGGGSADAGAAIRLLARYWRVSADIDALCRDTGDLGADVPACIVSRTRLGTGTGIDLQLPGRDDAAGLAVLLVNPRVPLATGPVFAGWDGIDRGALATGSVLEAACAGRNDLETPAVALCPPIADVLSALRATRPVLARMSGSGATCFALFSSDDARDAADARIAADRPEWWRMRSRLR